MKLSSVALSLTIGCCGLAHADPLPELNHDPPMFSFGGFGTFGLVHSSRHDGDFTATTFKPNGAGFSHDWSSDVDSLIAGQITANFSRHWSAVLQVVSEQNDENSYKPAVEWANVKFQVNDAFDVRAGRTPLPAFMVTDTRKLGYANPWVRPPLEVYELVPVTQNDGVDASFHSAWGAGSNTLHMTIGRSNSDFPLTLGAGTVRGRQQFVLTELYERGFASVRLNYSTAHVTIDGFDPLLAAFETFGPQGAAIAARYRFQDRPVTFYGAGASYDPQDWFVMGEWGHIKAGGFTGINTGWYLTGGYRFHSLTPYVTYSRASSATARTDPGLTVADLPPAAAPAATQLNGYLNSNLATIRSQHTVSFGARWDIVTNVAAKLQFDHTLVDAGSDAQLRTLQPNYPTGGTLNLISISVDFVF